MSRSVLSGGIVIGAISRASVCEFVEFTFIGILKTEHTPMAYLFSTKPLPLGRVYFVKSEGSGRRISPVFSSQTAHAGNFAGIRDKSHGTNSKPRLRPLKSMPESQPAQ